MSQKKKTSTEEAKKTTTSSSNVLSEHMALEGNLTLESMEARISSNGQAIVDMGNKLDALFTLITSNMEASKTKKTLDTDETNPLPEMRTPAQERRASILASIVGKDTYEHGSMDRVTESEVEADDVNGGTSREDTLDKTPNGLADILSFGTASDGQRNFLAGRLASSNSTLATVPAVTRFETAKECKVKIDRLQLSVAAAAVQSIIDFQDENEQKVRIQRVLSRNVKEHLRLAYGMNNEHISAMQPGDLIKLIAYETRVQSVPAFYDELNAAITVKIPPWSEVNPITHEAFYKGH